MLVSISELSMEFKSELSLKRQIVLDNLNFQVEDGDCLGILGESGSGKSTLGRILTGILKPTSGKYIFDNVNPYEGGKENRKFLSDNISVVFQDYTTSVNPRFTVFEIIKESLQILAKKTNKKIDYKAEVYDLLIKVGLDGSFANRFSHQISGGQLQRVCIARAIAVKPKMILFDEPISSLDAHMQVQIMELLKKLKEEMGLTYIFITHDLISVTYLCNKVLFLYKGNITEFIEVKDISKTQNAYAKKLLNTIISI